MADDGRSRPLPIPAEAEPTRHRLRHGAQRTAQPSACVQVCDRPLLFVCPGFLTDSECEQLLVAGRQRSFTLPIPARLPVSTVDTTATGNAAMGEQAQAAQRQQQQQQQQPEQSRSRRAGTPLDARFLTMPAPLAALIDAMGERAARLTGVEMHADEEVLFATGTRPNGADEGSLQWQASQQATPPALAASASSGRGAGGHGDGDDEPFDLHLGMHWDHNQKSNGLRIVTVLCYLTSLPAGDGGETVFPLCVPHGEHPPTAEAAARDPALAAACLLQRHGHLATDAAFDCRDAAHDGVDGAQCADGAGPGAACRAAAALLVARGHLGRDVTRAAAGGGVGDGDDGDGDDGRVGVGRQCEVTRGRSSSEQPVNRVDAGDEADAGAFAVVRVRPVRGTAIVFFSLADDGLLDVHGLHGGHSVRRGTQQCKWTAQFFKEVPRRVVRHGDGPIRLGVERAPAGSGDDEGADASDDAPVAALDGEAQWTRAERQWRGLCEYVSARRSAMVAMAAGASAAD